MQLYAVCEPWLRVLGVWPLDRYSWVLKVFFTLSVGYLFVPEICYLSRNYENVELFGGCFCELMVVCQGIYKLLILMHHKATWQVTLVSLREAFEQYDFSVEDRKWINRLQFFIDIYIKMFLVTGFVYLTSPNIFSLLQLIGSGGGSNVTLLPETARIDLIFIDLKDSYPGYIIYTLMNLSTVSYIALVCGTTDILYLTTIYFGIFYLTRISDRLAKAETNFETLRDFSKNHYAIIRIFKLVHKLSKTFMLIMYFSNLSMTCFIGLVLTVVPQTTNSLINFTLFLGTVQVQMAVYSYIGEKLLSCSRSTIDTLWHLNWYEQPVSTQRMVVFIMMQAQNNKIALSASSILDIGYGSYLLYLKNCFRVILLLQSFYL